MKRSIPARVAKHARLNWKASGIPEVSSPPFLILFINSICNMKCEHCFYWQELNQRDDLSFDELADLSRELGPIEILNLSGGEPFIRPDFGAVCRQFIQQNGVREIYTPTNGYFTDRTVTQVRETLKERDLHLLGVELSLDGMAAFHDKFRVTKGSFERSMQTYDALAEIQAEDPRLQIHSISVATEQNMDEIRQLTTYLYERCPRMSHHNLAIIRGERKNPSLQGPALTAYEDLYRYIQRLWAPREKSRYGSIVEPMLQWAKIRTAATQRQLVPCRAGILSAVVHANGDVGLCEQRKPLGNLRHQSFREIWHSQQARRVRASIKARECYCTNEVFLWPSITYQPLQLAKAMIGAKVWQHPEPLPEAERADWRARGQHVSLPVLQSTNG